MRGRRLVTAAVTLLLGAGVLAGCGGDDGEDGGESAADLLTRAKTTLDAAPSLAFELSSEGAPDSGQAVLGGRGSIARPSSFDGTLQVQSVAGTFDLDVVSIDGTVYAQLPFAQTFSVVDPATLGFGDPGALIDPDTGISQLLTAAEDPQLGGESRVNGEVVREVTADVPGELIDQLLTTADADAPVQAVLSVVADSGQLRRVQMTGPFFEAGTDATYTIELTDYGSDVTITAPPTG
ncbi:LppX_LprAFG lipoprotein [Modestobacter sp. I12A-02628]|uniref:LppX_LprAFG lipoprotein n=1 Tax=Goekera deserti TaxID=2497753 RepID=A0A7K3WB35_9ACTN|nr:LppX_LprAFG lipoprotein [Goekera deserti]MPQ97475.1 LppX_LprAFG lipoprotein [Goekera deserti]NDI47924.1 LppX_LprAFG lipoprotein [Goekera deserti]NEL53672.1 LppX_LprAFG lipoprotein [Goekera deserti]